MKGKWLSKLIVTGALAVSIVSCMEALVPLMTRDVSGRYDLTSPYEYVRNDEYITPFAVNPAGVSIKYTKERSDGSVQIVLGGTTVTNGIPQAMHEIMYPQKQTPGATYLVKQTDYPRGIIASMTAADIEWGQVPPDVEMPLENGISLGAVSKNSKFTAISISGMVQNDKKFVVIREQNESLRVFSENYVQGYNNMSALFNPNERPMLKSLVYFQDPNLFSENGYNPTIPIYRGSEANGQKGGFNVLIWDGANPKQATYSISYDNGKTYRRTIIDWSAVQFADAPLQTVFWTDAKKGTEVNTHYKMFGTLGTLPVEPNNSTQPTVTVSISRWDGALYPDPDNPPPTSCAEGLSPSFVPANATNRNLFFTDDTPSNVKDGSVIPIAGPMDCFDNGVAIATVEYKDRVRVTAKKDGTGGNSTVYMCYRTNKYKVSTTNEEGWVFIQLSITVS